MFDKDTYLKHIIDNEVVFKMRRLLDHIQSSLKNHSIIETDFFDPYERRIAESILNRFQDISYKFDGGLEESERKCIVIYPEYISEQEIPSVVAYLRVEGILDNLSHKDYLGAVLGLGITRDKIGDILLYDDFTLIIVKKEIKDYIMMNFEKAGNQNIRISEIKGDELQYPELSFIEVSKFVSSLRLDVYLSAAYNISRSESRALIKSENVKVNWGKTSKADYTLEAGDVISVRGKGRTVLHEIGAISKKGRLNLKIRKLV
ncbi:YlmH family RNA-binding protein [Gudongella sp. SC589]|jgi:RNA-binding protein YlmH|uniref:YlmH family RNA-binding protein n=1 Tax=Gudongella sp. SC589 TaxID=3385990 RepID=UPI003904C8D9